MIKAKPDLRLFRAIPRGLNPFITHQSGEDGVNPSVDQGRMANRECVFFPNLILPDPKFPPWQEGMGQGGQRKRKNKTEQR